MLTVIILVCLTGLLLVCAMATRDTAWGLVPFLAAIVCTFATFMQLAAVVDVAQLTPAQRLSRAHATLAAATVAAPRQTAEAKLRDLERLAATVAALSEDGK